MAKANSNEKVETEIFHMLFDVVPDLMSIEEYGKSKTEGFMDLGLDVLHRSPEKLTIALSHYYRHPSGDMIPDPDMMISVFPKQERAAAISYQDACVFQSVLACDEENANELQHDLNLFLSQWLSNLIEQGHRIALPLVESA